MGRMTEKVHERSGSVNYLFKTQGGPTIPERCPECKSVLHVSHPLHEVNWTKAMCLIFSQMAGPMWSDSIHDTDFVTKVLSHLEDNQNKYRTSTRMKGMLTVAREVRDFFRAPDPELTLIVGTQHPVLLHPSQNSRNLPLYVSPVG